MVVTILGMSAMAGGENIVAHGPEPQQWLTVGPEVFAIRDGGAKVAPTLWHEVRVTILSQAVYDLREQGALPLTKKDVEDYVGHPWEQPEGKQAFLVRALYSGSTGHHELFLRDGTLLVLHSSLGDVIHAQFSPLVVCLDRAPVRVVNALSVVQ